MCQPCIDIVPQDPSLGTSVPPDSEIQVVSVQKLIERKIISYSGGHDYKQFWSILESNFKHAWNHQQALICPWYEKSLTLMLKHYGLQVHGLPKVAWCWNTGTKYISQIWNWKSSQNIFPFIVFKSTICLNEFNFLQTQYLLKWFQLLF